MAQKKPNTEKIAREFGVSGTILKGLDKKTKSPTTRPKSLRTALSPYQEKTLADWIVKMLSWNLPPTAGVTQARKMWASRSEARLPEHLNLAPVKQKTKELKRIQAEDAGFLQH
jgi:hypothetical protein